MNDKDKEAFKKWWDEIRIRGQSTFGIVAITWQAACEYKQKEIDELLMDNDLHKETFVELKSKINELETFIRADAISTNWENKEFQEATRYNWLDDEIRRVEHHNFNLQAELLQYKEAASSEAALVNELQAENAKMRECLEFTTHAAEYLYKPDVKLNRGMLPTFYFTLTYEGDLELMEKTKRARQVLKELEDK